MLIGTGVFSYFSDAETASDNTFTTGMLNLQVGSADPCTESISVSGLVPGSTGHAATWQVQNTGNVNGDLGASVGAITNSENSINEVEADAGDVTSGATEGELGANLKVALWMDVNGNGNWDSGDYYLVDGGTAQAWQTGEASLPAAAYVTLDSLGGDSWADVQTNAGTGSIGSFRVEYELPLATTSVVQGDSCVFDIQFTLDQS